jgi:hypothetical protein
MKDNPFDYINKKDREQIEREKQERERQQKLEEALKIRQEEAQRVADKRRMAYEEYDKMVSPILAQLCTAAYPYNHNGVTFRESGTVSEGKWYIGYHGSEARTTTYSEAITGGSADSDYIYVLMVKVSVTLEFDSDNRPVGFRCFRDGGYFIQQKTFWGKKEKWVNYGGIRTGLSREELLQALKQLHPKVTHG